MSHYLSPAVTAPLGASLTRASSNELRPDLPPSVAATALRKLIAFELKSAGFEAAEAEAMQNLEGVVYSFFGALLQHSHALAEHAGRSRGLVFSDVIVACEELGVGGSKELLNEVSERFGEDEVDIGHDISIHYDQPQDDVVVLDIQKLVPSAGNDSLTESYLHASYLPVLPPRHSYRTTPVFPLATLSNSKASISHVQLQTPSAPALAHLATLASRVTNSQDVAQSLRNLIRVTSGRALLATGLVSDNVGHMQRKRTKADEAEERGSDVVDYESEWYSGAANLRGGFGKRRELGVIQGGSRPELLDEGTLKDATVEIGGKHMGEGDVGRGGGVVKRWKWKV